MPYRNLLIALLLLPLFWGVRLAATEGQSLPLPDGGEMPYQVYPGDADTLFLMMPMEFGPIERMQPLASALGKAGHETWLFDPYANHFLPVSTQSVDKIPAADIAALIRHAHEQSGKQVMLITTGRGAIAALRGVRQWQQQHPEAEYYRGTIMFHPKLYVETPAPGEAARYMPIAYASNLPLYIFSPTQSPSRWRIMEAVPVLEQGGSPVYVHFLDNVRNFFFVHPEPGEAERHMTARLPQMIVNAATLLESYPAQHQVAALPKVEPKREKKALRGLEPYQGSPQAAALRFYDTQGKLHVLEDYRGQVWYCSTSGPPGARPASRRCPPCSGWPTALAVSHL